MKNFSFSSCVFFILFHVTRRKIVSKLCYHTIATFPFQALLRFVTFWFMVIKSAYFITSLYTYRTSLYKGVSNLSRRQSISLLIFVQKTLIWFRNFIIDYIRIRTYLCDMFVKGELRCVLLMLIMQPYNPTNWIKFTMCIGLQLSHNSTLNFL